MNFAEGDLQAIEENLKAASDDLHTEHLVEAYLADNFGPEDQRIAVSRERQVQLQEEIFDERYRLRVSSRVGGINRAVPPRWGSGGAEVSS